MEILIGNHCNEDFMYRSQKQPFFTVTHFNKMSMQKIFDFLKTIQLIYSAVHTE